MLVFEERQWKRERKIHSHFPIDKKLMLLWNSTNENRACLHLTHDEKKKEENDALNCDYTNMHFQLQ